MSTKREGEERREEGREGEEGREEGREGEGRREERREGEGRKGEGVKNEVVLRLPLHDMYTRVIPLSPALRITGRDKDVGPCATVGLGTRTPFTPACENPTSPNGESLASIMTDAAVTVTREAAEPGVREI